MKASIERNFQASGRPKKWKPLAESTLERRKGRSPKILIDSSHLKNSMSDRLTSDGVEVGTNVIYAKRQHFGYPGGSGRGHSKTPARPFMLLQEEDIRDIGEVFKRHIARK